MMKLSLLILAAISAPGFSILHGAIVYPTMGATITENFNGLSSSGSSNTWQDDTTIPGWYAATRIPTPSTGFTTYTANSGGTAAAGLLQSLGSGGDRALGSQNSNSITQSISYGAQIVNTTGGVFTSFTLGYAGEQWRTIQNQGADGLTFDYQVFDAGEGSLSVTSGWIPVAALAYTAPVTGTSSVGVNGNAEGRVEIAPVNVSLTWGAGQELWIRWTDGSVSGASRQAAVGIDDVTFSAVPEPSATLICAAGFTLLAFRCRGRGSL